MTDDEIKRLVDEANRTGTARSTPRVAGLVLPDGRMVGAAGRIVDPRNRPLPLDTRDGTERGEVQLQGGAG